MLNLKQLQSNQTTENRFSTKKNVTLIFAQNQKDCHVDPILHLDGDILGTEQVFFLFCFLN